MTKFDHLVDLEKRLDDSGVGKTSDWLYYQSSRINRGVFKTTISRRESGQEENQSDLKSQ